MSSFILFSTCLKFLSIFSTQLSKASFQIFFSNLSILLPVNAIMISMSGYTYILLFNIPREYPFTFNIIYANIYFISFAKSWNFTSSHNICPSFMCLYEFEILQAKVFLENKINTFWKTTFSTRYIRVYTFKFQTFIELVSTSSVFRTVYSAKTSKIPIDIACLVYRRMVVKFIKYFVY